MKEYSNYLSRFYGEGSEARNLPETTLVWTEHEVQRALSRALLEHGVRTGEPEGKPEGGE